MFQAFAARVLKFLVKNPFTLQLEFSRKRFVSGDVHTEHVVALRFVENAVRIPHKGTVMTLYSTKDGVETPAFAVLVKEVIENSESPFLYGKVVVIAEPFILDTMPLPERALLTTLGFFVVCVDVPKTGHNNVILLSEARRKDD